MFCLFDLWVRISWLSSLEKNDASVIAYQGSHSPALSEWALLMAFSKEESISGVPLEDNNTPISSALMLSKLPWFFPPNLFQIHTERVTWAGGVIKPKSPPHWEVARFIHNSCRKTENRLNCHNSGQYRWRERERNELFSFFSASRSGIQRTWLAGREGQTPGFKSTLLKNGANLHLT